MQGKLFDIPPIRIKRPTISTIDFSEAYEEMAEEIISWEKDGSDDLAATADSLKELFSVSELLTENGYELAKKMERNWALNIDTELVNILDGFSSIIYTACNEAERKWVKDCCITPKYSVGYIVKTTVKGKEYFGKIVSVYNNQAQYVINIPELGHAKEGEMGTQGTIKNFEDIEEDFFENNKQ
jgi:hypothetical protein